MLSFFCSSTLLKRYIKKHSLSGSESVTGDKVLLQLVFFTAEEVAVFRMMVNSLNKLVPFREQRALLGFYFLYRGVVPSLATSSFNYLLVSNSVKAVLVVLDQTLRLNLSFSILDDFSRNRGSTIKGLLGVSFFKAFERNRLGSKDSFLSHSTKNLLILLKAVVYYQQVRLLAGLSFVRARPTDTDTAKPKV